jgi:hypothetical protein
MATRKQQKRRHKRMVHESYDHAAPTPAARRRERPEVDASSSKKSSKRPATSRRMREVPEPSLRRSARRGLFVYVTLAIVLGIGLLGGHPTIASALVGALPAALLFVPFDYFIGGLMYRRFAKRTQPAAKRSG